MQTSISSHSFQLRAGSGWPSLARVLLLVAAVCSAAVAWAQDGADGAFTVRRESPLPNGGAGVRSSDRPGETALSGGTDGIRRCAAWTRR